ncbi:hypothetical protein LNAOJCKE_0428 [Methylorubrum aminovorans]|uniref:Uncharacterized protein n=1 Tax=Methylorubrum aminovorans TaxID=269069 RepID=A0ABQ4U7Q5_9HYPH|nr:hypothetical protein [Methylorubrum aminovorans]GJE63234.1 hypothetical protein LNAOJCKE_0428 [Methylorubrum aminovorans]GMA79279.1 hypothetical protein GCM10025880_56960 [Methylorubrum aminovorans]
MNPISLALTAIRVITTLRPSTPVDAPTPAPAPKRGKKAAPVAVTPRPKNYKPLVLAAATGLTVAAGLYSGHIDGTAALSMISSIDFNGIMAIFQ